MQPVPLCVIGGGLPPQKVFELQFMSTNKSGKYMSFFPFVVSLSNHERPFG